AHRCQTKCPHRRGLGRRRPSPVRVQPRRFPRPGTGSAARCCFHQRAPQGEPRRGARPRPRRRRPRQERRLAHRDPGARLVGHPEAHLLRDFGRPGAHGSGGNHVLFPPRPVPGHRGHGLDLRPLRRTCDHRGTPERGRQRGARRGHVDHRGAGEAHRQQGRGGARFRRHLRPPHRAVERQPSDEGDGGRAERRLRRARRAQLHLSHGADPELHPGRHPVHPARHGRRGGAADRAELRGPRRHHGNAAEPRPLAGDAGGGRAVPRLHLPLRAGPRPGAMALGELGQRGGRDRLGRRFGRLLLLRDQLRQLQRDLRLARRGDRLHDLDLDLFHRRAGRGRAGRGDGAPDGARHHGGTGAAARRARRQGGGRGRGL
ncbi:MAG: Ribonuclease BN, partial [uncultured Acetobacteraceae bacterium]